MKISAFAITLAIIWYGASTAIAQTATTLPATKPAPKPGGGQRPPTSRPKPPATQLPSPPNNRPPHHKPKPPHHRPPGWSGNYYPGWRPAHWRPIHRPAYHYPHGYHYRRWTTGQILAHVFLTNAYYFNDYRLLGLYAPPPHYRWVRYGPDLLLVDIRNGRIYDVIYGAFI